MQVSQEAGQVAWYSHLFQNFPQSIVTHTVKGFGIVNKLPTYYFIKLLLKLLTASQGALPGNLTLHTLYVGHGRHFLGVGKG